MRVPPSRITAEAAGRAPAVIVTAPPWLRTGTGRVIEDQIGYYRDRGYVTGFIGVPVHVGHVAHDVMWTELAEAAGDLGADHASFAILDRPPNPRTLRRRLRQRWRPRTELDWIAEIGELSRPTAEFMNFASSQSVALLHVNHLFTLGFARRLRARLGYRRRALPIIVETHDIQSQIVRERGDPNPWTGRPDVHEGLIASELAWLRQGDALIHCSCDDKAFFEAMLPEKSHTLALPPINRDFIAAVTDARSSPSGEIIDVLFVGTGHTANGEAIAWLLTEVWPLIADREWRLRIVGGVEQMVRHTMPQLYERFRDCFTGRVADLVPYYRSARCVIAPMRSGGGISIKTIEALAVGKPFVGTTKAFRGLPHGAVARAGLHPYDDPKDFAQAIIKVLTGDDGIAARGRALYDELFSKELAHQARDQALRNLATLDIKRAHAPGNQRTPEIA